MAKKRSIIRQQINKILYSNKKEKYIIYYIDRPPGMGITRLASVNASRVIKATEWAMILDDDTVIPLHRVVEIRDESGRLVWSRSSKRT
ncbi:MAG: RNA repair domain-containing protein [Desulfurococcales archaeon]|nr:RNA repair domain-containing protein [Desulfurococcales archaeon]